MHLVTAKEMRALDQETIGRIGIPASALMENAGKAIAEETVALARRLAGGRGGTAAPGGEGAGQGHIAGDAALTAPPGAARRWLVLVGKGNNGGDGLVAARYLSEAGFAVSLLYAVSPEALTGEAARQRDAAAALGLPAEEHRGGRPDFSAYDGLVDALLGTGTSGAPRGPYAELIAAANESGRPVVSADIPSGLDADTGQMHTPCIRAAVTVCLAFLKRGLLQQPGAEAAGRVVVRQIGIPSVLARSAGIGTFWLNAGTLAAELGVDVSRRRSPEGHKGTYGHVLVAGGTLRMSGAGLLSARAALRIGAGLVTWAMPSLLLPPVIGTAPEIMLEDIGGNEKGEWTAGTADKVLELAAARDAVAVGPGMGRFDGDGGWLKAIWESAAGPLVVDADALNMLAGQHFRLWKRRAAVLTPHPGEMARLAGLTTAEVQRDRIGLASSYAQTHGVVLVLKGAYTVIAGPDGRTFVNTTGHPGMGTGGAGDVLTGMIAGLLAQGLEPLQAAAFGVYLHGLAGEEAARGRGNPASLIAGDIIEAL